MQGEELQGTDMGRMSAVWRVAWAAKAWFWAGSDPFSPPFPRTWRFSWTNW